MFSEYCCIFFPVISLVLTPVCVCVFPEILKKGSLAHPLLLKREVEAVRDKQRSPLYCDQLLHYISSLPTETTADCPE